MTSPSSTASMYDAPAFIHPRIAGSREMCEISATSCPAPGAGTGSSVSSQSDGLASPDGRAARRTWWFIALIWGSPVVRVSSSCACPSIDDELGAGHIDALVGGEVDGGVGDLLGRADATQGDRADQPVDELGGLLALAVVHVGVDLSGV